MARALGAEKLVLHLWDGLTSDCNFENNLEAYGELSGIADRYGIMILVENVVCNVASPFGHWRQLAEKYSDIRFVFDTKMAAFHQEEGLLYQPEYAWLWNRQHICHYHVNDYGGGYKEWAKLRTFPLGRGMWISEDSLTASLEAAMTEPSRRKPQPSDRTAGWTRRC